jgi:Short C-terminal domain
LIGPFALAPGLLRKSKAVAFVVCANGKVHERKLDGTAAIRAAQRDAVKFNVLAGPAAAPGPAQAQPLPSPPTAGERLAEVTRLHDAGLLTDEEYQAKRAEIIGQL